MSWNNAQIWEQKWHGTCQNTYGEEEKQLLYANRMGLQLSHNGKTPYNFSMNGKTVLDIGGGVSSLLLKCLDVKGMVVDPLRVPDWVSRRYELAEIDLYQIKGEDLGKLIFLDYNKTFFNKYPEIEGNRYDEVWIYNCLQHTEDPEFIIKNAKRYGKIIRIFEWVNTKTNEGHPQLLTEEKLNKWLGGKGKVEQLNGQANCFGKCYYGIFPSN